MSHSVQAYIGRRSDDELCAMLKKLIAQEDFREYAYAIELIWLELRRRNYFPTGIMGLETPLTEEKVYL